MKDDTIKVHPDDFITFIEVIYLLTLSFTITECIKTETHIF